MKLNRTPISVSEAINKIMDRVTMMEQESVPIHDAQNRILSEPIHASHDVPLFDRAAFDGYAVRSLDTEGASGEQRRTFRIVGQVGAGQVWEGSLHAGEAVRIMTGAKLPADADAVVMLEQAVERDGAFRIRKPFAQHEHVSLQGEEVKEGELLLKPGMFIHPGGIAVLATFGFSEVKVARRPLVGILCTGTELLQVDEELVPGKIRNSNGPMITAQLARLGIPSRYYGMVADNLERCLGSVMQALEECDLVITTGGVSVGDYDYLPDIYHELGAEVLFNKVAMRPGSVTTAAILGQKLLFGLSGNPSACFTGFELFARPALLMMMGAEKPFLPYAKAYLEEDFPKPNPFMRFVRAVYESTPIGAKVRPAGFNKSNAVTSIANANAILILPGGTRGYAAGREVDVLLLGAEEGANRWML